MKSIRFIGSVELSGKFATRLIAVLLNGRLQDFVIQGRLSSCSSFIKEKQISRPEFLKPMPCRTCKVNNPERARLIRPFRFATVRVPIDEWEQSGPAFITTDIPTLD
ncbi:hypothetical protein TNCV_934291 [Trichonephila clavipes]|nr:hypothetical protein TNCV_934291 [Trichonephila clavipes]